MNTSKRWFARGVVLALVMACGRPVPAEEERSATSRPKTPASLPSAGFWPTPRMVKILLKKGITEIAGKYGLDKKQADALEKEVLERYPAFLDRHRAAIQPIISQVVEMGLAEETPTAKQVAKMAGQLGPVLKDARKTFKQTQTVMRPLLRKDQRTRWDGDFVKLWAGLAVADAKLVGWKQGKFKPGDWENLFGKSRRPNKTAKAGEKQRELSVGSSAGTSKPTSEGDSSADGVRRTDSDQSPSLRDRLLGRREKRKPSRRQEVQRMIPLDKWQAYVKRFIKQYELDEGQANQAMAILKDVRQQAKEYEEQYKTEFEQLRLGLARADADRRERLWGELAELQAPLRDLLEEMRERLDGVLRSDQQRSSDR